MVKIYEPDYKHYKIPYEYLTYKNWKSDPNYLFDDSDEAILKKAEKDFLLWKKHINELAFNNTFHFFTDKKLIPYCHSVFSKVNFDLWNKIFSNLSFEDIKRFSLTSRYAHRIVQLYSKQRFQRMVHSKKPMLFYNISKANIIQSSGIENAENQSTEFDILELFQSCINNNSIYYIDLFEKFSSKRNTNNSFSNLLMNTYKYNASNNVKYLNKTNYPSFYQTEYFSKFYGKILNESIKELLSFYKNDYTSIYNSLYFIFNMTKDEKSLENVNFDFKPKENVLTIEIEKEDQMLPEVINMPIPNADDIVIPNVFRTFIHLIQNSCAYANDGYVYQMFIPSQFCPTSDISVHALHEEKTFKLIMQGHIAKVINEIIITHSKPENKDDTESNNSEESNTTTESNTPTEEEVKWPLEVYYIDPEEASEVQYKKEPISWFEWLPFMGIHEQLERELRNFVADHENPENQGNPEEAVNQQNEALGQQLNLNMNVDFNRAAVNAVRENNAERERRNSMRNTRSSLLYININSKSKFYGAIGHLYKGRFEIITNSLSEFIKTRAVWNFMRWCGGKHEMLRNYLWPMLAEKEGCLYGFRKREVLSGACRGSLDDLAFSITNTSYTSFIEFYRMLFEIKSLDYELI